MFRALVSLLSEREKNEPLQAAAYIALAPIRPYIIGGSGAGQFPPDGGWEKWLDKITVEQAGDGIYYSVCGQAGSGGSTGGEAVELFCAGRRAGEQESREGVPIDAAKPLRPVTFRRKKWWE